MADRLEVRESTIEELADGWGTLLELCPAATVFLTPTWHRIWWERFGDGGRLHILEVRRDGRQIGIVPLMEKGGVVSFLGDTDLVDYHDVVASGSDMKAVAAAMVRHVAGLAGCHTADLKSIPADSPTLAAILEAADAAGWRCEDRLEDVAPGVALAESFEAYVAGLRKKDRHELRRKLRRLHAAGEVAQDELKTPDAIAEAFEAFIRLVRLSSPEKDAFLVPERVGFIREATLALAAEDRARLFMLRLNGERVAGSLCFRYGDRFFGYNSGYDPAHRPLAVGLLNHALCLESVIGQGARYFDFMRGDEPYKYDLGAEDREVHHVVVRR